MKPWFSTAEGTYVQGINEMLLQSDEKAIRIAPAVPDHWRSFSFCLAAVGVDFGHAAHADLRAIQRSRTDGVRWAGGRRFTGWSRQ